LRALFDVNLLIALFQPDHMHHRPAHEWWDSNREEGWATCPLTENGFVRIVSQTGYARPMPAAAALRFLAEQFAETNHAFWPDNLSLTDAQQFHHDGILGPKQLTDVYLLGLAVANGGRLATFDRSISIGAVHDAESRHLAVLQ
jgi:toxin-antitoxin system PIN domain toxin